MSENLKHECGIALIRLFKHSSFYEEKYGDQFYGLHIIEKLMKRQKHRGQDGAGIAHFNFLDNDLSPGISHFRSASGKAMEEILGKMDAKFRSAEYKTDGTFSSLF